jgi:hypothetical protein
MPARKPPDAQYDNPTSIFQNGKLKFAFAITTSTTVKE